MGSYSVCCAKGGSRGRAGEYVFAPTRPFKTPPFQCSRPGGGSSHNIWLQLPQTYRGRFPHRSVLNEAKRKLPP